MTFIIINFILLAIIFVAPFLYRSKKRWMIRFCQRMASSENFRKFYAHIMVLILIFFHFTFYWQHVGEYGLMLSTFLIIFLFSPTRTVGLLQGIRNNRFVMGFVFTLTLAALFTPHLYTLGVTLGYLLVAIMYYPSWKSRSKKAQQKVYSNWDELADETVSNYYH